jgi:hypothetical protein
VASLCTATVMSASSVTSHATYYVHRLTSSVAGSTLNKLSGIFSHFTCHTLCSSSDFSSGG